MGPRGDGGCLWGDSVRHEHAQGPRPARCDGDFTFCVFYHHQSLRRKAGRGQGPRGLHGGCGLGGGGGGAPECPLSPPGCLRTRQGTGLLSRWRGALSGTHTIILHTSGGVKYFIISEIFIRDFLNI